MSMVRRRRDLAADDHEARRHEGLARDAAERVLGEDRIEDGVRDLVGHLVRMTLGDGLGGEVEVAGAHARIVSFCAGGVCDGVESTWRRKGLSVDFLWSNANSTE